MQGIVLTQTHDLSPFLSLLRSNGLPLLKIVSGWGYPWDDTAIETVCQTMPSLIVRTVSGDGCTAPPAGQSMIFLEPQDVMAELAPWLAERPNCYCELGNEPNMYDASDDAAHTFAYWFDQTVTLLRMHYPSARLIAPGLTAARQSTWWAICRYAFLRADLIGFHAYAWYDFTPTDNGGQVQACLAQLAQYYPDRLWIGTELGINDSATSPEVKAERYRQLHTRLPSQVAAACWYHYTDLPQDADQRAYQMPPEALPYLEAGGDL